VPVILTTVLALPTRRDEAYDVRYTEANKLRQAGVTFCIAGNGSGFGAPSTRSLPYHAAMAAAFGLPRDEALRAVTLYPAQILGVGASLGSIEVGKSASLMLTSGDPLEIMTRVERVFIDGRAADPGNKHQRLYEKYQSRPALAEN
jgi:imidazolonepropionase-like amidohydrolase